MINNTDVYTEIGVAELLDSDLVHAHLRAKQKRNRYFLDFHSIIGNIPFDNYNIGIFSIVNPLNRNFFDMTDNGLNWNEIINRIFYVFPRMSQKEIAEKLNVSPDLVSGWKKNRSKPSWELLEYITRETSADFDWLLLGKTNDEGALAEIHFNNRVDPKEIINKHAERLAKSHTHYAVREMTSLLFLYPSLDYNKHQELANRYLFAALTDKIKIDWRKKNTDDMVLSPAYHEIYQENGFDKFTMGNEIITSAVRDWRQEKQHAEEFSPNYQQLLIMTGQMEAANQNSKVNQNQSTMAALSDIHRILGEIGYIIATKGINITETVANIDEIRDNAQTLLKQLSNTE